MDLLNALAEVFTIPFLLLLFFLFVFSLYNWVKEKFNSKSLFLFSFLINIVSAVILLTSD